MRQLTGIWKGIAALLAAAWVIFIFYTALTVAFHPLFQGAISLGFGLALVFLLYPLDRKRLLPEATSLKDKIFYGTRSSPSWLDIALLILAVTPCIYIMLAWEGVARAVGRYETHQLILGAILALLLLEGTRRALGKAIPILVLLFLLYALLGQYIPGLFGHAGFKLSEILYQLYLMTEGIWGLLTDYTSRVIALFILFAPVVFATGVGNAFMRVAQFTGGRATGGAGQISVVSSALFGMISGSSAANVAVDGPLTIPTMKRLGYRAELAGAIEATASSGGQIMPPIMGAGAFIMAEFLNIPYTDVMVAAFIPAIVYFAGVWAGIYVEAKRMGLGRIPPELIPKAKEVFFSREAMTFFIALGVLIYLLLRYLPPQLAAAWALIVAMGLFLLTGGPLSLKALWERIKVTAGAFYSGVTTALAWLMVMMSCVQMAVTIISLTGFGVKLSELIIELGGISIILALVATMVTALILGMGMPTTAAYVIAAAVIAPALMKMGMPALAAHLFIFYFATKSALTPPVCIAVYTAAAISGGNILRLAWIAMRLGIGAYIMPYFFLFEPAFLMQGEAWEIMVKALLAILAMFPIEAGVMGQWLKPATILERLVFIVGGLAMIHPSLMTDLIGLILVALGLLSQKFLPPIPVIGTRPVIPSQKEFEGK